MQFLKDLYKVSWDRTSDSFSSCQVSSSFPISVTPAPGITILKNSSHECTFAFDSTVKAIQFMEGDCSTKVTHGKVSHRAALSVLRVYLCFLLAIDDLLGHPKR